MIKLLLSEFNINLFEFTVTQLLIFISSVVKISNISSLEALLNLHERVLSSAKTVNLKKSE